MLRLRRLLLRRPASAAVIVAAAMLLRLLVPAGYMPVADGGRVVLAICTGVAPGTATMAAGAHGGTGHHEPIAAGSPCAFADLALPIVGGADPVLLLAAIAFMLLLGIARRAGVPPRIAARLRPPSHAPPLPA